MKTLLYINGGGFDCGDISEYADANFSYEDSNTKELWIRPSLLGVSNFHAKFYLDSKTNVPTINEVLATNRGEGFVQENQDNWNRPIVDVWKSLHPKHVEILDYLFETHRKTIENLSKKTDPKLSVDDLVNGLPNPYSFAYRGFYKIISSDNEVGWI